jgi:hypothetical protein
MITKISPLSAPESLKKGFWKSSREFRGVTMSYKNFTSLSIAYPIKE